MGVFMVKRICFFSDSHTVRTVSLATALFFAFFVCTSLFAAVSASSYVAVETFSFSDTTVILDAGHGGEDGGAVGENGVFEKDLNLEMSKTMAAILRSMGARVIETRTEDRLLYTEEENIKGYRKVYDLKNRLAVAEENREAIFVSIHMNRFTDPKYSGLQIYYSKNHSESRVLANGLQKSVREHLAPENKRETKAAGESIYLLDRAENIALLIECGFLSNPEECEKLCTEDYRKQLSFVLVCGIINYIEETRKPI